MQWIHATVLESCWHELPLRAGVYKAMQGVGGIHLGLRLRGTQLLLQKVAVPATDSSSNRSPQLEPSLLGTGTTCYEKK